MLAVTWGSESLFTGSATFHSRDRPQTTGTYHQQPASQPASHPEHANEAAPILLQSPTCERD